MGEGEEEPTNGGPEAPDSIKIGVPIPISGQFGPEGQRVSKLLPEIVDNINADGGIYLSKYGTKIPIDLRIVDIESDASRTSELTAKLISDYEVDLIMSVTTPLFTIPMSVIAEREDIPIILNSPIDIMLHNAPDGGYHWSWFPFFRTNQMIDAYMGGLI